MTINSAHNKSNNLKKNSFSDDLFSNLVGAKTNTTKAHIYISEIEVWIGAHLAALGFRCENVNCKWYQVSLVSPDGGPTAARVAIRLLE